MLDEVQIPTKKPTEWYKDTKAVSSCEKYNVYLCIGDCLVLCQKAAAIKSQ